MKTSHTSCVPCCMLVSKFKLLVCHEDLETNFIRTLGAANLHDITALLVDPHNTSYLILVQSFRLIIVTLNHMYVSGYLTIPRKWWRLNRGEGELLFKSVFLKGII